MTLLDRKAMKAESSPGGSLGPTLRHASSGGRIAYAIGTDLPAGQYGQPVNLVTEYRDHIGLLIQFSTFKHRWLIIPKQDVLEWGVLERGSIPALRVQDHSSAIAGALLYGPIGALVGAGMDKAAADKREARPVIGITYGTGESESAVFLEFPLAHWYQNLNDFLLACLPRQHRE